MTYHQQDISWTDSPPVAVASGSKAQGKGKRRIVRAEDAEKRTATSCMDEREWNSYHYGDEWSRVHAAKRRFPYVVTARQLGLKPRDWKDEKYRQAYHEYFIVQPEHGQTQQKIIPDGIFLVVPGEQGEEHRQRFLATLALYEGEELKVVEPFDPKSQYAKYWMTADMKQALEHSGFKVIWDDEQDEDSGKRQYKIGPGNNSISDLERFMMKNDGKSLVIGLAYNRHYGFGVILCTPKMAIEIGKRGFEIEEFDASMYGHVGGFI